MALGNRNQRLNGLNPLAYIGDNAYQPPEFITYNRAPTPNDSQNFYLGTIWLNNGTNNPPLSSDIWILVALNAGIATWVNFIGDGGLLSLSGNTGTNPVFGDVNRNINVLGDTVTTTSTGNAATNTITISVTDNFASTYTTDDANFAIPVNYNLNVFGANGIATTSGGDTVTIGTDGTIATTYDTDSGSATPIAGVLNIVGDGVSISTSGAGNTITITQGGNFMVNNIYNYSGTSSVGSATYVGNIFQPASSVGATFRPNVFPIATNVSGLSVNIITNASTSVSDTLTFYKNGVATALQVSFAGGTTGVVIDTANTIAMSAGDTGYVELSGSTTGTYSVVIGLNFEG